MAEARSGRKKGGGAMIRLILISVLLAVASSLSAQNGATNSYDAALQTPDAMPRSLKSETSRGVKAPNPDNAIADVPAGDSNAKEVEKSVEKASRKLRVLLIGDSMCDGLGSRFSDYAAKTTSTCIR